MAKRPPSLLTSSATVVGAPDQQAVDGGDWFGDPTGSGVPTSESPTVGFGPSMDVDPPIDTGSERTSLAPPRRPSAPAFVGVLDTEPTVAEEGPPLSKRAARLLLCVAVLAAGGFAVSVGTNDFLPSLFDRADADAASQRVEVAAAPPTTAEPPRPPITRAVPQVRQLLATPDGGTGMEKMYLNGGQEGPLGPIGLAAGDDGETEPAEPTEWVEPDLGPESEWVDSGNGVLVPDLQLRIRFCESTNNYAAANAGSSARGAYQFLVGSWDWYGHAAITGVTEAHLASPAQQDEAALRTLKAEGARPWAESRLCWGNPDLDPRYATAKPPTPAPTTQPPTTEPSTESTSESTPDSTSDSTTDTTQESTTSSEQPEATDTTSSSSTDTTQESTTSSEQPETTDTTSSSSTDSSTN